MQDYIDVLLISPNGFSYQAMFDNVWPRKYQYDYALCSLATTLQNFGFNTRIIDGFAHQLNINYIKTLIEEINPKIIGITTCAATIKEVVWLIEELKKLKTENKKFKNLEIILGGRHITKMPQLIEEFGIKYALLGDAEHTLPLLCKCIIDGKENTENIPGLAEATSTTGVKIKNIESITNLDVLPVQNLDLFINPKLNQKFNYEYLFIEASRGCPNRCYFCATPFYRRKVVYKSPEKVVEEMKELFLKYKTNFFIFIDTTFSSTREHVMEICRLLKHQNLKLNWACSDRIDTVDEELLKEMKKAGCEAIFFGIESGSESIRALFNKSFTNEKCIEIFKLCKKVGITPSGNFIIGLKNETIEDIRATQNLALKLDDSEIFFKPLIVLPDSIIYDELLNSGKIQSDFWHKKLNNGKPLLLNTYSGFSQEFLNRQVMKAYRKYYFRIKSLIKILYFINDIQTFNRMLKFRWIIALESFKEEVYYPFKKWLKRKIKFFY